DALAKSRPSTKPKATEPPSITQGCRSTCRGRSKVSLTVSTVPSTAPLTDSTVPCTASLTDSTVVVTASAAPSTVELTLSSRRSSLSVRPCAYLPSPGEAARFPGRLRLRYPLHVLLQSFQGLRRKRSEGVELFFAPEDEGAADQTQQSGRD